jgi:hypothetical protein
VAPGVDADDQPGVAAAHLGDERHHSSALFVDVDLGAFARLHAADVHDVGARGDRAVHRVEGRGVGEGRALVVERVGRAVDDGHDQGAVAGHATAAEDHLRPV